MLCSVLSILAPSYSTSFDPMLNLFYLPNSSLTPPQPQGRRSIPLVPPRSTSTLVTIESKKQSSVIDRAIKFLF